MLVKLTKVKISCTNVIKAKKEKNIFTSLCLQRNQISKWGMKDVATFFFYCSLNDKIQTESTVTDGVGCLECLATILKDNDKA